VQSLATSNAPLQAEKHGSASRLHTQTQLRLQLFLRLAYDTKISGLPARSDCHKTGWPVYESFLSACKP